MVLEMLMYGRIFNIKTNIQIGSSYTLVILKINNWLKLTLNGVMEKIN